MKNIIYTMVLLTFFVETNAAAAGNPSSAYEGRRLYVSTCQLCHGVAGEGDGPLAKAMNIRPANLRTTVRSRSDTILTKIITGEGRQTITGRDRHNLLSEAMPKWKEVFTSSQVKSLIAYLRFLSRSKHELIGNPEQGKQVYKQYCQVCHGVEGEGDGIMTNLIGIMPMDFTNPIETESLSNEDIVKSIQDGKKRYMPAWRGILSQNDIEAVVSYIRLISHF